MNLFVIKRDQSAEQFEVAKISRVAQAAGLDEEKSLEIAHRVEAHFTQMNLEKVTSLQIRDIVLSELKKEDSYAANMFEWYEKTKEAKAS